MGLEDGAFASARVEKSVRGSLALLDMGKVGQENQDYLASRKR